MKLKLKKQNTAELFLWLIFICSSLFFGLYKYLPYGKNVYAIDYEIFTVFLVDLLFFILLLINRGSFRLSNFVSINILLLLLALIEAVNTILMYNQGVISAFKGVFPYFVVVLTFFIYHQFQVKPSANKIADIIVKVSIICSIVAVVAYLAYSFLGVNFLQLSDESQSNFRYNSIRFNVGAVIVYPGIIISFTRVISKKFSYLDIINLFVSVFQVIWVSKTRTIIFFIIVVFLINLIINKSVNILLRIFVFLILVFFVALVFINSDTVYNIVNLYLDSDAGIKVRFDAIKFYMEQFWQHPLFGMGFLRVSRTDKLASLLYGPYGNYFRDDVGIVGILNEFGLFGVLWCVKFFKDIFRFIYKKRDVHSNICRNLLIYCLISMINLSFLDPQRVMYIFIILIICEAVQREKKSVKDLNYGEKVIS